VICGGAAYSAGMTFPKKNRLVRWTEIGGFDFFGQTASSMKNTAGEMYIPGGGTEAVLAIHPMTTCVIVYCTQSVWKLTPVKEPAPTFSPELLCGVGIANPLAAGGNEEEQVFVDRSGFLHAITYGPMRSLTEKRIGYQEFFKPMQENLSITTGVGCISVVYNAYENEYYISNSDKGYIFKEGALTGCDKIITSMIAVRRDDDAINNILLRDAPLAVYTDVSDDKWVYAKTDVIDFNLSAIKTIMAIEVEGSLGTNHYTEVAVEWRRNRGDIWRQSKWKKCSPSGIAFPIVSGTDFRIIIRSTPIEGVNIERITVEWKLTDKSSVRGNYTNASNASA
jgi:hypothetical protein